MDKETAENWVGSFDVDYAPVVRPAIHLAPGETMVVVIPLEVTYRG